MHEHKKQELQSVTLSCSQAHFHQTHVSHNKYFDHTSLRQLWFWWGRGRQQRTSATSSPDDESFLQVSGRLLMIWLKAKNVNSERKNNWSCYREISISHRMERVYAMTFEECFINNNPHHLGVAQTNKASKRVPIWEWFKDLPLWSSQKRDGMAKTNNSAGTWGVSICDVVLMRHILEVGGCLKNENTGFTLPHLPPCCTGLMPELCRLF